VAAVVVGGYVFWQNREVGGGGGGGGGHRARVRGGGGRGQGDEIDIVHAAGTE
jgi:hypothetical protein